jgi:hypothetical protein
MPVTSSISDNRCGLPFLPGRKRKARRNPNVIENILAIAADDQYLKALIDRGGPMAAPTKPEEILLGPYPEA